jgi:XTP/dITP diphosphohydrolase
LAGPGRELFLAHGSCKGIIAEAPAGIEGFGYDPIFMIPEQGVTMASLHPELKNRISHRARAIEKTKRLLRGLALSSHLG